jgi:hypothetical protein
MFNREPKGRNIGHGAPHAEPLCHANNNEKEVGDMEPKDVLFFDKMLTPQVITFIYWILLVAVVLGGIGTMFVQSFIAGLIGIVVGLVMVRIWCELLIVLFKMNDALQEIRSK